MLYRVRFDTPDNIVALTLENIGFLVAMGNCMSIAILAALMPPATGRVRTQARKMFVKSLQSTFLRARAHPTVTTEPTLQWVVLMGRPRFEAASTVVAAPSSMQKPL